MLTHAPARSSRLAEFRIPASPEARALHQIRALDGTDRPSLQASLGISQPSVTRHVSALIDAGLVEEITPPADERVGRPRKKLILDGHHLTCWGMHIGIRSSELVIVDAAGRLLRRDSVALNLRDHSPAEVLDTLITRIRDLATGLPEPESVGVVFSAFVAADGAITSTEYQWKEVPVMELLEDLLARPVVLGTGVAAMAAYGLSHTSLEDSAEASTLYFYARDILGHSWLFNGRVHRPHSGRTPEFLRAQAPEELADAAAFGQHPLSVTALINACQRRGHNVTRLTQVVALAEHDESARELLTTRAHALAEIITTAVDVIDPQAVVLAGDTFTRDRITAQTIHRHLREDKRDLRVQLPKQQSVITAATQIAVQPIWDEPLAGW